MKTKEELEQIKKECEELNHKLQELDENELNEITGGTNIWDIVVKLKGVGPQGYDCSGLVTLNNATIDGHLDNRDDDSETK